MHINEYQLVILRKITEKLICATPLYRITFQLLLKEMF